MAAGCRGRTGRHVRRLPLPSGPASGLEERSEPGGGENMEGEVRQLDIHTPVFEKKKKHSVRKEKHRRHAPESPSTSPLGGEQSDKRKRKKKKRKEFQHLISSPTQPAICDETEKAPRTAKQSTKRSGARRGEDHAGAVYVVVDKENIENTPKNFRRDVDVVYVEMSKKRQSTLEPGAADVAPSVAKRREDASEPQVPVREAKPKRPRRLEAAPRRPAQGDAGAGLGLSPPEPPEQGPPLPAGPDSEGTRLPGSPRKKKSKKRKRRVWDDQGPEALALPEGLENKSSEGSRVVAEVGTVAGGQEASRMESRAKAGRPRPAVESALEVLGASLGDPPLASPGGDGTLMKKSATPRLPEESPVCGDEAWRLEPANEEESNLESARGSETRYSFEDSRESDDGDVDLDSAVRQLQEFIPGIKDRAATTIKRMYRDDLGRFKEFKAQGVTIKFGKFSAKENKQLERNVQEFLSLTGIENADKLLHTDRYPEEKAGITDLKRKYAFRLHIGKGIARPWKLVYYRAKKMFDIHNYKGRYSKGDTEKLKIYHALHGNDWKKIGEMVARSSLSVALKFSQISSERNHGAWSKTETQKLIKAVEEVILKKMSPQDLKEVDSKLQEHPEGCLSIVREKLYKGISWVEVEAKVETRNWMQCKSKWTEILTKRMTNGRDVYRGVNGLRAKISLIERLYEINVEDSNEIDWEDLASTIGDVPPSYVQTKFYKLKATCVPFWQKKTFPEIIDYLYETSLPLLKEKLEKKMEKTGTEIQAPAAPKQVFLFRDIFYCDDDDSEGEDVNEKC